jgi:hypothetical protein
LRPLAAFGLFYMFVHAPLALAAFGLFYMFTCGPLAALGLCIYLCAQLEAQERSYRPIGHKKRGRSPLLVYLIIAFNSALISRATGPRQVDALLKKYLTIESAVSMPKWSVTVFRECMASK